MADWSQLPPEVLCLIAKCLKTRFDVLRFRSVCSSWRSSFPPKVYSLPKYLPSKTRGRCEYYLNRITITTFYLVRLPPACWLVNIRDGTDRVKMRLLKPLSESELNPLPLKFPKVLALTNFQVIELGYRFVGNYSVYIDHPLEPQLRDYIKKVAFLRSRTNSDDFVMLAIFRYFVHYLAFLRSGEKESTTLLENVNDVEDIISFNGKFYAIEKEGRTIVIDRSLNVSFLDHIGSPTSRRFLVQLGDDLLAIEMLFFLSPVSDCRGSLNGNNSVCKVVGFRIFRLDEEEMKSVEMESLGNQILFLGSCQAISASASELFWGKGNLIFYSSGVSTPPRCGTSEDGLMFVFD